MRTKIILIIAIMLQTFTLFGQETGVKKETDLLADQIELLLQKGNETYSKGEYKQAVEIYNEAFETGKKEYALAKTSKEKYFAERRIADICAKVSDSFIHQGDAVSAKNWLLMGGFTYHNPWFLIRFANAYNKGELSLINSSENVTVKLKKDKKGSNAENACLGATSIAGYNLIRFKDDPELKLKLEDESKRVQIAAESALGGKINTHSVPIK